MKPTKYILFFFCLLFFLGCKTDKNQNGHIGKSNEVTLIDYAKGFSIEKFGENLTVIKITSPWPDAEVAFKYALVHKDKMASMTLNKDEYDAIVAVPVSRLVVTSTTHIPALEALGELNKLVGFPDTDYISSKSVRNRIDNGLIKELGNNESINTEMTIELNPDVVVGFGIDNRNRAYETLQRSNIPVVYNGDWTEKTPLGKAEWIKFFAPFFQKEAAADSIFNKTKKAYEQAKELAANAQKRPTVLSGALYKDVWYLPGGDSWAAQFISDANAQYLWADTQETGSLSLGLESVLTKGQNADFWISPSQFTKYGEMKKANEHYLHFTAFKNRNVYTFSKTKGETGGLLYYELAPQRPDLVLKDLIYIFHPELLPEHRLFFFKPLD
ncbi:ABC transporter substrate-binding protein [Maribacter algicola]|uniref:ABC transporter substrate-binding protein n=1 Tax=Meishania litoralis TaxID=3434685 RepID=A0ACC7LMN5_9FLAO